MANRLPSPDERLTSIWMPDATGSMPPASSTSNTLEPGSFVAMNCSLGDRRGVTTNLSPSTTMLLTSPRSAMSSTCVSVTSRGLSPEANTVKKMAITAMKITR